LRNVIISAEISLDAVLDDPQDFIFDFIDDELGKYQHDMLSAADALIMGRITYEGLSPWWMEHGDDEFGQQMNSLPKYVASRTLKAPLTWNATLMQDPVKEIRALKQRSGQNILQYGVGELSDTLLKAGLVDEICLLVYPVTIGKGERVFENIGKTTLKLLNSKTFDTGVIALTYQPVASKS
jgi:dihydrofolate reductase